MDNAPEDKKPATWKKLLILPLAALGAYLYRLRGGGPGPKLPRPIDQILFSLFPCIILPLVPFFTGLVDFNWVWGAGYTIAVVWAIVWECSGHGGTMDYAYSPKEPTGTTPETKRDLEKIEYLIYPWLYNMVPRLWYDAIGHGLTGFIVTVAPGIFIACTGNVLAGVMLALSGFLGKFTGYAIGHAFFNGTGAGEWISGGIRWLSAALVWVYLM